MLKQMQYDKEQSIWTGQLQGDLDALQASKIITAFSANFLQKPANVILDCKNLDFVDSMGLGALVKIRKLVEEKGFAMRLTNLKQRIKKLFVITGLESSFGIEVE